MAESSGKKAKRSGKANADAIITDKRFANIHNDPRYRLPSKRHTHVKLDNRFSHMLRDEEFSRNAAVDRYGRKLKRDDTKKQLERFYQLEDDDVDNTSRLSVDDDDEVLKELEKANKRDYDPARDGGFSESSSEESSSEEEDEEEEEEVDDAVDEVGFPNEQQSDVPLGEITNRIAVVNLDWDNIRAEDLMAVFSSFTSNGRISRVTVYPSEFGKERMEREEMEGPPKEIFAVKSDADNLDDYEEHEDSEEEEEAIKKSILKEDEGAEFNTTQLRQYQLERLRYFYAIIEFSSKETAKQVYDVVDGTEYLTSANFFDLRFVPDDTDFTDDKPRDQCERIPDGYRPTDFVTDALQHSKVKLTWDADDKVRKDAQAKAFKGGRREIEENDLKAYLASDSSDSESEEEVEVVDATSTAKASGISKKEAERQRMRALLGLSDGPVPSSKSSKSKGPVGDMEITFTSGLAGQPTRESVFENEPEPEETTVEKYIRKQRERKKQRKEKQKSTGNGETEENKDDEEEQSAVGEDLGFNDPFFDEPENKIKNSQRKEERRKKREEKAAEEAATAAKRAELELLMVDDQSAGMAHFDMNEIERAERKARKKGKKGKAKQEQDQAVGGDNFRLDVSDPRFTNLYESHEFAIDPTNPKFKATSGMKALLDESRKRRRVRGADDDIPTETSKKQKKIGSSNRDDSPDNVDLKKLVARVKGKTKKT